MRRYEGLLTEEEENYLNVTKDMSYNELMEYRKTHPLLIKEGSAEVQHMNMTADEICQKYGLVDMTDFFC